MDSPFTVHYEDGKTFELKHVSGVQMAGDTVAFANPDGNLFAIVPLRNVKHILSAELDKAAEGESAIVNPFLTLPRGKRH
jgi:hypothetical protein